MSVQPSLHDGWKAFVLSDTTAATSAWIQCQSPRKYPKLLKNGFSKDADLRDFLLTNPPDSDSDKDNDEVEPHDPPGSPASGNFCSPTYFKPARLSKPPAQLLPIKIAAGLARAAASRASSAMPASFSASASSSASVSASTESASAVAVAQPMTPDSDDEVMALPPAEWLSDPSHVIQQGAKRARLT